MAISDRDDDAGVKTPLPVMEAVLLTALGLALAAKVYGDSKTRVWQERLHDGKCPWCLNPLHYPNTGDPSWECSRKPIEHNADRKFRFYLW
ncbi:hypothetical protein [Erythrobacter sp. EC-HK427]|uniref:hypothetical protein n=1 Tax=Erythrobacter sp. EC-HK427 TaxID=2038396 RepID=UPI001256E834|nr:hypothetical protein [Erythrobacter sp. EC-HK427]VVT06465.1 hypothetical protein ERY430_41366 [Erythrobacter sp. EC-HK427]